MDNFVNKIKTKDGIEYDIQDVRLSSEGTGSKFLRDDFTWQEVGGAVSITYADLKALRDAEGLKPGMFYRITDYNFTTSVANTRSAGHQFDIIVLALTEYRLSEQAHATQHAENDYFAANDLSAWQLWYDLDNDNTKYEWADTVNGKGVIYRMIDEFNNDVPYDFKNLIYEHYQGFDYFQWGTNYTFVRDSSLDADGYYGWRASTTPSAWSNPYCFTNTLSLSKAMTLYSDTSGSTISFGGNITSVTENDREQYTFTEIHDGNIYDASVRGLATNGLNCIQNIIKPSFDNSNNICRKLNNITFYTSSDFLGCHSNSFGINCSHNTFGNSCINNNFGNRCINNNFGNSCQHNRFGNSCQHNTFDTDCRSNIFVDDCGDNTFGNSFQYNRFGEYCHHNTFDGNSQCNRFGCNCSNNKFGEYYNNNTFGNGCSENAFGAYCNNNAFGSDCVNNSFGVGCSHNIFGNGCYNVRFYDTNVIDYVRNVIVDSGCSYINLFSTDTSATDINYLQNIHIHLGVQGTSESPLSIEVPDRNLAYSIDYYATGSQTVNIG